MASSGNQYVIDGYNFLFRLAKERNAFKEKRDQFIEILNQEVSALSLNVIVVFDSSNPISRVPHRGHYDALEIIYTIKNLSADAFILEKIHAAKNPERITVVTSDRDLAASCKALKAKVLSIEAFVMLLKKRRIKKKKTSSKPRYLRDSDAEIARLLRIFEKRLDNID